MVYILSIMVYTKALLTSALVAASLAVTFAAPAQTPSAETGLDRGLVVPGSLAYSYPNRNALNISAKEGVREWSDSKTTVVWYGHLAHAGDLITALTLRLPAGEKVELKLTVTPGGVDDSRSGEAKTVAVSATGTGEDALFTFPAVAVQRTGYVRLTLTGVSKTGQTFGNIRQLQLTGSAAKDARFGDDEHLDRGAASVHLGYRAKEELGPVTAYYNEVKATADPITTYYCAIGWGRGYFGYQVNSPTERRVIFSVWDAGNEAVDPTKVAAEDRVQLLAKGKDVEADRFGNEGTGGHSHLVYPWKTGKTYRFLVTAQPDGPKHVIYAGYFFFPEKNAWDLIARFRAPLKPVGTDGKTDPNAYLTRFYSFDEDFWGNNGDLRRQAEFGPQWARTSDGVWHELTQARFTHTDNRPIGRKDFASYPTSDGKRFILASGGFVAPKTPIEFGQMLDRKPTGKLPADLNTLMENLPKGIAPEK